MAREHRLTGIKTSLGLDLGTVERPYGTIEGRVHARKVRLNQGGYDSGGRYYGGGGGLYHVYDDGGGIDVHVRAPSAQAALDQVEIPSIFRKKSSARERLEKARASSRKRHVRTVLAYEREHPELRHYGEPESWRERARRLTYTLTKRSR
jgi:hypothetical protein